ncbi:MAG: FHA domain-containing protein [Thermodesulfobacteriota bacterium]|nr:FHA domain-containing protein [Thermodesulfobacteriota bacterium]
MAMLKLKKDNSNYDDLIDIHERISIGRHSDNDIIVKSREVSRHHCLISIDENKHVFVNDLNSLSGTFVNNRKIDRIQVNQNDILKVGNERYVFVAAEDFEAKKETKKPAINLKSILFNEYSKERIASIKIRSTKDGAKELHCPSNSIYTIGRLQFCDIYIDDSAVSRTHATIDVRENRVVITDSDSTNGTFVNNEMITRKVLENGDIIEIGGLQFFVSFDVDTKLYFSSLKKSKNITTIDVLEDYENIIKIYKSEYNDRILLEVERQSLIFCQEFEHLFRTHKILNSQQRSILKFIDMFSRSMQVVDASTLKTLAGQNNGIETITSDYMLRINDIIMEREGGKIVYFEEIDPDDPAGILMNGISITINHNLQLLVFGIPYDNILYLIYASSWLSQFQVDVNETI